jgi:hypothetical protein
LSIYSNNIFYASSKENKVFDFVFEDENFWVNGKKI